MVKNSYLEQIGCLFVVVFGVFAGFIQYRGLCPRTYVNAKAF